MSLFVEPCRLGHPLGDRPYFGLHLVSSLHRATDIGAEAAHPGPFRSKPGQPSEPWAVEQ